MFINIIWFIAFVVLTVLAARFFMKTIRSSRMPVRFGGRFFVGFLTLLLGLISILGILGMLATYMPRGSEVVEVQVAGTAEQVERGRALASFSCAGCHSIDKELPLSGGENILADVPMPIGKATPPNLT